MWIVELGGSLAGDCALRNWLDTLARCGGGRVVIVPGGGPFADAVREAQELWGFSDGTAHGMALLAMEQYGLMFAGFVPFTGAGALTGRDLCSAQEGRGRRLATHRRGRRMRVDSLELGRHCRQPVGVAREQD